MKKGKYVLLSGSKVDKLLTQNIRLVFRKALYLYNMNPNVQIATLLTPFLFWDMDIEKLDANTDKDIIIPRALFATSKDSFLDDILKLESIYSKNEIISQLKITKERISNEVCEMISKRYSIETFHRFKLK